MTGNVIKLYVMILKEYELKLPYNDKVTPSLFSYPPVARGCSAPDPGPLGCTHPSCRHGSGCRLNQHWSPSEPHHTPSGQFPTCDLMLCQPAHLQCPVRSAPGLDQPKPLGGRKAEEKWRFLMSELEFNGRLAKWEKKSCMYTSLKGTQNQFYSQFTSHGE